MSRIADLYQQRDPMRPLTAADKIDSGLYVDWQQELGVDDVKFRKPGWWPPPGPPPD